MATVQTAQKVIREFGQTTCVYHMGQSLFLYCETCSDVLCMKCLSSLHKGHFVCDLNEVIPSMKMELRSYLNKNNRAHIKEGIESTKNEMKKTMNDFDSICREVKSQSVTLKRAIDIKTEKMLVLSKQMEEGNIKALTSFERELQKRLECFDDRLQQDYIDVLQNGSNLKVHDTLDKLRSKTKLPLMPILAQASFYPNTNPHSYMDRYFGTMTSSAYRPLQYTFLPQIIELSTFQLQNSKEIMAICTSSEDEAWLVYEGSDSGVHLINTNGDIQQTVPWELKIDYASVSSITKNLWVCSLNAVYELDVSIKSPASLLKTSPTLYDRYNHITCLCVTNDDQVIVGTKDKITKYTKDGKSLISTQPSQSGNVLVREPKKIAECCVSRNVAAIGLYKFGTAVVVMNQELVEISHHSGWNQVMTDLQYDTAGNLILCRKRDHDSLNSFLDVLSGSAELLKTIEVKDCLMAASLDTNGVLWTVSRQNVVKRLQYCKHSDE